MIPNAGLDNIAAYPAWSTLTGSGADSSGSQWLAYAAISEDSTAPSASDTNIGTEKMRTNATGGFNRTATAIRDPGTNRLGVTIERAYVFAITSSMNITKYGYVPVSSGGNFSWIDLVRADPNDPLSSPITLTLQNGDQLQLWQTFTVTVPWSVDLESFVITGAPGKDSAGTHDAYCGFYAAGVSLNATNSLASLINQLFWPSLGGLPSYAISSTPNAARDATIGSTTGGSAGSTVALAAYVSGSYIRDKQYKFTTAQGNILMTGINLQSGSLQAGEYGFKIVFSDPSTFTKVNTHELTLTFRVSWAEG